jgi:hypothetical protein
VVQDEVGWLAIPALPLPTMPPSDPFASTLSAAL